MPNLNDLVTPSTEIIQSQGTKPAPLPDVDLIGSTLTELSTQIAIEPETAVDRQGQLETKKIIGESMFYGYTIISPAGKTSGLKYDQVEDRIASAKSICIGDLHGSYEKLVETLIATNLASMPKESAKRYVELSKKLETLIVTNPGLEEIKPQDPPKTSFERLMEKMFKAPPKQSLTEIEKAANLQAEIIDLLKTMKWSGPEGQKLILIGDIIGDRGVTDTITLELLSHLSAKSPDRIIRIASNHDHCAAAYLLKKDSRINHHESQLRAFQLSKDHDSLVSLYREHLAELKLMHYDSDTQTLYSHAPITPANFETLIANLKEEGFIDQELRYQDINEDTIAEFVEISNAFYREAILFPFENGLDSIDYKVEATVNDSNNGFLWRRCRYADIADIPLVHQGVKTIVHGHDSSSQANSPYSVDRAAKNSESPITIVNLDNQLRKSPEYQSPENCRLFVQ
jgi:hypothetical protein